MIFITIMKNQSTIVDNMPAFKEIYNLENK